MWLDQAIQSHLSADFTPMMAGLQGLLSETDAFRPFCLNAQPVGMVHQELESYIQDYAQAHHIQSGQHFADWHLPVHEWVRHLNQLGLILKQQDMVPNWRNETQVVTAPDGQIAGSLERALFKRFGLTSTAVHVHGVTPNGLIWVASRSRKKKEHPGLLDNICAGGVCTGETPENSAWRELEEEAGLDEALLQERKLLALYSFVTQRPLGTGWHRERCHLYLATIPAGVVPANQDGEVSAFSLMTRQACINACNQLAFTPDAGLCTALALSQQSNLQSK